MAPTQVASGTWFGSETIFPPDFASPIRINFVRSWLYTARLPLIATCAFFSHRNSDTVFPCPSSEVATNSIPSALRSTRMAFIGWMRAWPGFESAGIVVQAEVQSTPTKTGVQAGAQPPFHGLTAFPRQASELAGGCCAAENAGKQTRTRPSTKPFKKPPPAAGANGSGRLS